MRRMDQREIDELRALCDSHAEQDENGVDLSLIRCNLKLTPTERLRKAERARRGALRLFEYGKRFRKEPVGAHRGNSL